MSDPIAENAHVKALMDTLRHNAADGKEVQGLVQYIGIMEGQLEEATAQLTAMREEIAQMRDAQQHPIRTALENAADALEEKLDQAGEKLEALKASVVQGCKDALSAVKEKGASALNSLARFFHVQGLLNGVGKALENCRDSSELSMKQVQAITAAYHEAGLGINNMGRAVMGKEASTDAHSPGLVARSALGYLQVERNCFDRGAKAVKSAAEKLEALDKRVKKPSVLGDLEAMQKKVAAQPSKAREPRKQEASI